MRLAVYGFADPNQGSLLGANYLVLSELLDAGCEIDFFNKDSFVRLTELRSHPGFRFVDCANQPFDSTNRYMKSRLGSVVGYPFQALDHHTFARCIVRQMRHEHQQRKYERVLYLGTSVFGAVPGVPSVAWLQGPPGTDARSIYDNWDLLRQNGGIGKALAFKLYAAYRLSLGAPNYRHCDRVIVGSSWSADAMRRYVQYPGPIDILPYPMDPKHFGQRGENTPLTNQLKILWLGRIVPRKRMDVFLRGCELAVEKGVPLSVTIVGQIGFFRGLAPIIEKFAFPDRLKWIRHLPKNEIPNLIAQHDVLGQPSDEENFGSAVAEAQLLGLPVIVGPTNGTADYICHRSLKLKSNTSQVFAEAIIEMGQRISENRWGGRYETQQYARQTYSAKNIVPKLLSILASNSSSPDERYSTSRTTVTQDPVTE